MGRPQQAIQRRTEGLIAVRRSQGRDIPAPLLPGNRRHPVFSPVGISPSPKTLYGAARFAVGEI
jgi:hypothetical protein